MLCNPACPSRQTELHALSSTFFSTWDVCVTDNRRLACSTLQFPEEDVATINGTCFVQLHQMWGSDLLRASSLTNPQVWTLAWAPEIQTISVSADAPTREVFNITTGSAEVLPEVQLVTVSYDDVDEVQTITTSQVCA